MGAIYLDFVNMTKIASICRFISKYRIDAHNYLEGGLVVIKIRVNARVRVPTQSTQSWSASSIVETCSRGSRAGFSSVGIGTDGCLPWFMAMWIYKSMPRSPFTWEDTSTGEE